VRRRDAKLKSLRPAFAIRRDILQLGALMLAAVGLFFLTRAVAASNRHMSVEDAAEWYSRGERALEGGRMDEAIDALRRANVRNRSNLVYQLALARALARNHDDEAARAMLLTIRDSDPENAEINLELARLAADRHDVTETLRFYHNALYAPWPADAADQRRDVRLELIRFLLAHRQAPRAVSELMAVAADLPDRRDAHTVVGELFAQAGDDAQALAQFQRALRASPNDAAALAGAGKAAFRLRQYALARTYLRRAPGAADDLLQTTQFVLADDPLAARIGAPERRRRLADDVEYARQRLADCAGSAALQDEARALADRLKGHAPIDQDVVENGVDLVARIGRSVVDTCPAPAPRDRALVLIGREHGAP